MGHLSCVVGRMVSTGCRVWLVALLIGLFPLSAAAAPATSVAGEVEQALAENRPDRGADAVEPGKKSGPPAAAIDDRSADAAGAASARNLPTIAGFAIFPVAADFSFTDTFGAPRSEGRTHAGIDIFAPKLSPVVAVADGVVLKAKVGSGRSGTHVVVGHPDGTKTYYLHLNNDTPGTDDGLGEGIAPGIAAGVEVTGGTILGYVGDSGNAEETPPHLHFEFHVSGAGAVDPYTLLVAAQRGELGVLSLPALPFTGPSQDRALVWTAIGLILAGWLIVWRDRQLEIAIGRARPVLTLTVQFVMWRGTALERLLGVRQDR